MLNSGRASIYYALNVWDAGEDISVSIYVLLGAASR